MFNIKIVNSMVRIIVLWGEIVASMVELCPKQFNDPSYTCKSYREIAGLCSWEVFYYNNMVKEMEKQKAEQIMG